MAAKIQDERFSVMVSSLQTRDAERRAREDRMRNALAILAYTDRAMSASDRAYAQFVRATAREGLGRDGLV